MKKKVTTTGETIRFRVIHDVYDLTPADIGKKLAIYHVPKERYTVASTIETINFANEYVTVLGLDGVTPISTAYEDDGEYEAHIYE